MISQSVHVVALCILVSFTSSPAALQAQPARPCPRDATPVSPVQPTHVHIDDALQPAVRALLAKSATFRRQWDIINASPLIRVTVLSTIGLQVESRARARACVSRYAHGSMRATIEIPAAADITELLPHELEHVIEQLEGVDLPARAGRRDQGVVEVTPGVYETARARAAGLRVVREVYDQIDPAIGAAVGRMKQWFRGLAPRPKRVSRPAAAPPAEPAMATGGGGSS